MDPIRFRDILENCFRSEIIIKSSTTFVQTARRHEMIALDSHSIPTGEGTVNHPTTSTSLALHCLPPSSHARLLPCTWTPVASIRLLQSLCTRSLSLHTWSPGLSLSLYTATFPLRSLPAVFPHVVACANFHHFLLSLYATAFASSCLFTVPRTRFLLAAFAFSPLAHSCFGQCPLVLQLGSTLSSQSPGA